MQLCRRTEMEFFRQFGQMPLSRKLYFVYAIIGITAGLSAGPTFLIQYQNYVVFVLAMITMLCGICLFHILWAHHKTTMVNWTDTKFKLIIWINAVIGVAGFTSMIVFLVWSTITSEPMLPMPKGNNKWMIAVWSWMSSKWAMSCAFCAYRLQQKVMASLLLGGISIDNPGLLKTYDTFCLDDEGRYALIAPRQMHSISTQTSNSLLMSLSNNY